MGVRLASVSVNIAAAIQTTAAGETIGATTPPLNLFLDNAQVLIFWGLSYSWAVGATSSTIRLRRGTTIAGTLINTLAPTDSNMAVGATSSRSGVFFDTPGVVSGVQYTLTFTANAQTANGQIQDCWMVAMVL
jgi:hypothetical protein